ncbi:GYF domain-containing protein [Luteolibacter ambystomatis]
MNFFIGKDGRQLGPFTEDQLRSMFQSGMLTANDLAWYEGRPDWIPLWQLFGTAPPIQTFASVQANPAPGALNAPVAPAIIAGYLCAVISLLIFPIILAPAGLACGIVALMRRQTGHGFAIIILSCVLGYFGMYLGALAWS